MAIKKVFEYQVWLKGEAQNIPTPRPELQEI